MSILQKAGYFICACVLLLSFDAAAQIAVPPIQTRVTDLSATLSAEQKATLEQSLRAFETKKGSQLAVLIVPTTAPESIEQYALRVAEKWKLGRKKVDDGVILLVAKNDRTMRIEVGYGLEGALNDATAKRIIAETMTPYFKQGDYYAGIKAGTDQIMRVIDGEPLLVQSPGRVVDSGGFQQYAPILFVLALVVGGVLRAVFGRLPGAIITGGVVGVIAWFVIGAVSMAVVAAIVAMLFSLFSGVLGARGIGAYYGGSGRGGFGGSGGGFSGGGGSFGGGGASGRW
ncbi:TPM domain-containing protein [Undibacterium sp. Tian12W]|uniref:TPM domain-containing protein n=1 Tax=Undibacterium sp. Tian12W TaxID=3413054 RepID=UPI003BF132A6